MGKYLAYKLIHLVVFVFPRKFCYVLGERAADLIYLFSRKGKRNAKANLRQALGGDASSEEVERYARATFRNFGKYLADFFRFARVDGNYVREKVEIRGLENLDRAMVMGKGVIVLTAHLGNWELGGVTLGVLGYPLHVVALSHDSRLVNRLFVRQRAKKGLGVIPVGAAVRRCYQVLNRKQMVALVGDRDVTAKGITTEFFGRPTTLPKGPASFSVRTGAPILPGFMIRKSDDSFWLMLEPAIVPEKGKDREEEIALLTRKLASVLEKYIRRYPEQWFMFHPMWERDVPGKKGKRAGNSATTPLNPKKWAGVGTE